MDKKPLSEQDIRATIAYTLEDIGANPTPQNIGKVYTLVMHVAAKKQTEKIERAILEAIKSLNLKGA